MNKKRPVFLLSSIILSAFISICFFAGSSLSSTTGKAKGTTVVQPKNPVNNAGCLNNCHSTVKMLNARGAHKNVNCASCHEVPAEHAAKPSEKTRPKTNFSHESCGQCHVNEFKSMYSDKYHDEWTTKEPNINFTVWADPGSTQYSRTLGKIPRYHVSVLTDLAVPRSGGRFQLKDGLYGWNTVGGRLWDNIYDAYPEDGNEIKNRITSTAWHSHRAGIKFNSSICLKCKTGEFILDWPYMGVPHEKAKFNRATPPYELLKAVNYSATCNLCHDPHSAEPRVIHDSFIRAMTDPEFKDNVYQSNPNKTKIEVIEMGVRGFVRKIAILEKYDSKLQCGQCHFGGSTGGAYDIKTNKFISSRDISEMALTPLTQPNEFMAWYKSRGWYLGKDPETGALLYNVNHPHMEIVTASKHGKAGLGCTDCHFATEKDQKTKKIYKSHQASLPALKVQQTCITDGCHGKGSKQNWTEKKAMYNIKVIQHLQRKRLADLELQLERLVAGIIAAQRMGGIDKSVIEKAKDAQSKANFTQSYWAGDFSNGIHNPELSEQTLTKAIQEAQDSYEELNKALKVKGAAK
jgi:nitrite reductase (cytochrome c-552)